MTTTWTTTWLQILHFYQPPTQTHDILRKVAEESYRPLIAVLKESPGARVGVNMNAVLSEMLVEHGFGDVTSGLAELAEQGRVEFLGSGRFHPILPLIPVEERKRSIAENLAANKRVFGKAYRPRGFFLPELAYSQEVIREIQPAGHDWILLSGVSCPESWPTQVVYRASSNGSRVAVLFRDDVRSNRISFRETTATGWIEDLQRVSHDGKDHYVVTAMDAETFGHHIHGWEREFLGAAYAQLPGNKHVRMMLPSEAIDAFPEGPVVEPFPSSWSTTRDDIGAGDPYPLWSSPGNTLHALQWEYVDHVVALTAIARRHAGSSNEANKDADLAGELLQPALHSCQFWWASRRPWWDVTMIRRGLRLLEDALLHAARSVMDGHAPATVRQQVTWRLAAANDVRVRIERTLIESR